MRICMSAALVLSLLPASLFAQLTAMSEISFDTLPEDVTISSATILLDGPTDVNGNLSVDSVSFPDGSVQTSAALGGGSFSANNGIYENRIVDFTPPNAFTEICIKNGGVQYDVHSVSESTAGGQCVPGDLGWVIERDERPALSWTLARMECLKVGMRLPEAFEYQFSCLDAVVFGLSDMTDDPEWASNTARDAYNGRHGVGVNVLGGGSCGIASWGWVGSTNGSTSNSYRCVR